MVNNKFLVRLKTYNGKYDEMLAAYYTKNISETIKLFHFMKENDIGVTVPNRFGEKGATEYDGEEYGIEEILFSFGTDEIMPCLDVWITTYT